MPGHTGKTERANPLQQHVNNIALAVAETWASHVYRRCCYEDFRLRTVFVYTKHQLNIENRPRRNFIFLATRTIVKRTAFRRPQLAVDKLSGSSTA